MKSDGLKFNKRKNPNVPLNSRSDAASTVRLCSQSEELRMAEMQVRRPFVKCYLTKHCRFNPSDLAHLFAVHCVGTLLLRQIRERTFRYSQRVNRIAHLA